MENWEKEERERLDKEIPEGIYTIEGGKYLAYTGKNGYINYLIELKRFIKEINPYPGILEQMEKVPATYSSFNIEDLKQKLLDLMEDKQTKENERSKNI